jgi:hypothetical protein
VLDEGPEGWVLKLDAWVTVSRDSTGVAMLSTADDLTVHLSPLERLKRAEQTPPMSVDKFNALYAKDPASCADDR